MKKKKNLVVVLVQKKKKERRLRLSGEDTREESQTFSRSGAGNL